MAVERVDPLFLELQAAVAGRYSLERELGRGGMGIVYLARDVALDRPVAIKLLPPDIASSEVRERFLREARTAARLSHPNIIPIHAVEDAGRLVFFVMALVPGITLGERIRTGGPLPAAEAGRILREVAWALGYAHQQGVVHRDVKADNILLDPASRRALVSDFGIAGVIGSDEGEPRAGTVAYMSPEQAVGAPVDGRGDLYALGVVGYLALSGTLPHPVVSVDELVARQLAGPPRPLSVAAPHAPRALCRTIDRCLQADPEQRFQSAEDLAAALDQLSAGPSELPAPLRVWLTRDDRARSLILAYSLGMSFFGVILGLFVIGPGRDPAVLAIVIGSNVPWLLYAATRLVRTRRVLSAGYTGNDLILAIQNQLERQREELAFEIGKPPSMLGRWIRRITWASFIATIAMGLFPGALDRSVFLRVWFSVAGLSLGGALVGMVVPGRELPTAAKRGWKEKLWSGPFGRFVVRVAGWRLGRRSAPDQTLHRPTEVALGDAAEALFNALPAGDRKDLAALPTEAARLSRQAQGLRQQLEQIEELMHHAAPSTLFDGVPDDTAGLIARRDLIAGELRATVALLESLRLGLLKLHAGTIAPSAITEELSVARALGVRIDALADAQAEVRGLLRDPQVTPT